MATLRLPLPPVRALAPALALLACIRGGQGPASSRADATPAPPDAAADAATDAPADVATGAATDVATDADGAESDAPPALLVPPVDRTMAGNWQVSPDVGAGLDAMFRLFPDGRFRWTASEMACNNGVVLREGRWGFERTTLVLSEERRAERVGGRSMTDSTGCRPVGAVVRTHAHPAPVLQAIHVGRCRYRDREASPARCATFDGRPYWRVAIGGGGI